MLLLSIFPFWTLPFLPSSDLNRNEEILQFAWLWRKLLARTNVRSTLYGANPWQGHKDGQLRHSSRWTTVACCNVLSATDAVSTKRNMDIVDRHCHLGLPCTIDYHPAISRRVDVLARDCQAPLGHKIYAGGGSFSIFPTDTRGRLINYNFSDPPDTRTCYGALPAISFRNLLSAYTLLASGNIYPRARPRVAPWLPPSRIVPGLAEGVFIKLVSWKGEKKRDQQESMLHDTSHN